MSFKLHPKAKAAMLEEFRERFPSIQVKNRSFLNSTSVFLATYLVNNKLPTNGKLNEQMVDLVDDLPFVEFATEFIREDLNSNHEYDPEFGKKPITEIEEYSDANNSCIKILDLFETLPWNYILTGEMPGALFPEEYFGNGALSLGKCSRIVRADLVFNESYSLHHENPRVTRRLRGGGLMAALQIGPLKWSSEKAYFQYDGSGLVGIYGGGNLLAKAESQIESFLGICLATRILSYRRDVSDPEIKSSWTVQRSDNDINVPFTRFEMSSELLDVLRHVRSFEFNENYPIKSRGPWLTRSLDRVNKIFEHDLSENFIFASKWYFDSFKGSDVMLRYVRLITTLEILLGERADTSKSSLGEILGNRLAYLIGKSYKYRSIVMDDFRKIYGVRSKILHHGKHRLKGEERYYISRRVEFCQKALERESELLLST